MVGTRGGICRLADNAAGHITPTWSIGAQHLTLQTHQVTRPETHEKGRLQNPSSLCTFSYHIHQGTDRKLDQSILFLRQFLHRTLKHL